MAPASDLRALQLPAAGVLPCAGPAVVFTRFECLLINCRVATGGSPRLRRRRCGLRGVLFEPSGAVFFALLAMDLRNFLGHGKPE